MSKRRTKGFIVPVILISFMALVAIGTATMTLLNSNYSIAQGEKNRLHAQLAVDAGADYSAQQLNLDHTWTGAPETTVMNDGVVRTTFSSVITDDPSDELVKRLVVTGRSYKPVSSATPRSERKYEVTLRGIAGSNSYSVVTGVGGLEMENSAKIVGGEVFVNGTIDMGNTAQIGLTTSPVNVTAAHQNCPVTPDSTYPRQCGASENGQPITIKNHAKIYGEVKATNQTNTYGMLNPGLVSSASITPLPMPSHDRASQVAGVTSTVTGAAASCSGGTRTWAANTKVVGDINISNQCKVLMQGNVWVTGRVIISNSSQITVANGLTERPVLMIDGSGGFRIENGSKLISNLSAVPVGMRVITYWSSALCSPGCVSVTGPSLASSQKTTTITITNSSSAPESEFYARWSQVILTNSGNIGAVVGQTVKMTNSATITFGSPVSGMNGEVTAWVVSGYRRLY